MTLWVWLRLIDNAWEMKTWGPRLLLQEVSANISICESTHYCMNIGHFIEKDQGCELGCKSFTLKIWPGFSSDLVLAICLVINSFDLFHTFGVHATLEIPIKEWNVEILGAIDWSWLDRLIMVGFVKLLLSVKFYWWGFFLKLIFLVPLLTR